MSTALAGPAVAPARDPGSSRPVRIGGLVLLLTAVVVVLLVAFAWPSTRSTVHGIPLGLAGPGAGQVEAALPAGAFTPRRYADEAAARAAIRNREVYGAVLAGPGAPTVLTASAASATVAQALGQVATRLGAATGTPVRVQDVVPAPAADPRGAGLAAGTLPLVIAGMLAAGLLTTLVAGRRARVAGALAFAVVGGAAMAAVLQFWIGAVTGPYLATSAVLALGVAAVTVPVLALESVFGPAGLGLGGGVMIALGNPLSGATSAPEMLPDGWGRLGQLLPPGAESTLLRSVSFFDGGGTGALAVLLCWLAGGLLLAVAGATRQSRRAALTPAA